MRTTSALSVFALFALALSLTAFPVAAESGEFVSGQRALGPIVISELAVRDGLLVFRADSGGCTDASSFVIDVAPEDRGAGSFPHYRLTIRRVRADDCKALLVDGVRIEIHLEDDLGLSGHFTVTVTNPVLQSPAQTR